MSELVSINPNVFDDELDFFPLYNGLKPSSMGLRKISSGETVPDNEKIFLFGSSFSELRRNKEWCRQNNFAQFYQKLEVYYPEIIQYIVETLANQNKEHFTLVKDLESSTLICHLTDEELVFNNKFELIGQKTKLDLKFIDAFDALAMQVPDDLVIHHVPKGQLNPFKKEEEKLDFASLIHLCHCNGWTAEGAIGKSFSHIHEEVPRIDKIIRNATRMLLSFLNRDVVYERVAAISIKATDKICRHDAYQDQWYKPFNAEKPHMHLRVERQTVSGFPNSEAFLFTIRTYLYDLNTDNSSVDSMVKEKRHESIIKVIQNPPEDSYAYTVLMENQAALLKWLGK